MASEVKTQGVKGPLWVVWDVVANNNFANGTDVHWQNIASEEAQRKEEGEGFSVGLCEKRSEGLGADSGAQGHSTVSLGGSLPSMVPGRQEPRASHECLPWMTYRLEAPFYV